MLSADLILDCLLELDLPPDLPYFHRRSPHLELRYCLERIKAMDEPPSSFTVKLAPMTCRSFHREFNGQLIRTLLLTEWDNTTKYLLCLLDDHLRKSFPSYWSFFGIFQREGKPNDDSLSVHVNEDDYRVLQERESCTIRFEQIQWKEHVYYRMHLVYES